jgi:hypothetical protein
MTDDSQQRFHNLGLKNVITEHRAISCNISKSPDCLFANFGAWAAEKLDQWGHGTIIDDQLGLLRSTRCNIGQCPS